ncbi:MAG TPA: SEC-C metal-binding domain-containing protein, partial [Saccharospirillum sp.]|nr:SEC-C metal-binding domain-containing protein [Saccharospirillum sp.]
GAVTIATNMAGRGTDIKLGGNWETEVQDLDSADPDVLARAEADWKERNKTVIEAGGLHIIGTERHESRRIDNQLRGRAGRQGDPGSSRFFLSMEDSLMRIFMPERMKGIMQSLGMKDGEAIEAKMVSNAIEKAQRKVENRNFDIRKQLLEYDDVANSQRQVVYQQRDDLMAADSIEDVIDNVRSDIVNDEISQYIPPQSLPEQWDIPGLEAAVQKEFGVKLPIQEWLDADDHLHEDKLRERILEAAVAHYKEKESVAGPQALRQFEKQVMLQVLDQHWKEHLYNMDHLRQGIHLRGYAQKNPKQEYKRESFELFQAMLEQVKADTIRILSHVQVRTPEESAEEERKRREAAMARMNFEHSQATPLEDAAKAEAGAGSAPESPAPQAAPARQGPKVGRNEPCPCGSGKKYKHCHGKLN